MITLYLDLMSQPARACSIFCRVNQIPAEEKVVRIANMEMFKPEYREINPTGKLPCLQEDQFVLPESAAILRYLADSRGTADHWYPKALQHRARVDSALDWYHGNIRFHALLLTWYVAGKTIKPPPLKVSHVRAKQATIDLSKSLKIVEHYWLQGRPFIGGSEISIADLLYACELDQMQMLDGADQGPTYAELFEPFPKVQQWLSRVAAAAEPHWSDATTLLRKVAQRAREAKLKETQSKL